MVNIRAHVPIILDQWRRFFSSVFGKFGIHDHIIRDAIPRQSDADWAMIDESIVNWLYTSVSKDIRAIVVQIDDTAIDGWEAIEELFHDNSLHRAVYLETEYCSRLKTLADQLRDVGHPVFRCRKTTRW
ncbi:hypothetical protein SEVIR_2G174350v4 [Setaria viridis]|uniref:uncharacterized protein n=1 Tax=Setaria viridis TaxID=4556 RepID=UPI003B3AF119